MSMRKTTEARRRSTPWPGQWSPGLEGAYVSIAGVFDMKLDLDRIKRVRPEMADLLRKHGG